MTKEENIATLNEHLTHWKRLLSEKICDQDEGEKTIDALQNAIKALEQEPTDAVDRVTIKEYLESFGTAYELGKEKGLDIALDILDKCTAEGGEKIMRELPSVTPQPCEDCVSRRAVYEILNDAYFLKIDDGAALQESVRQLPSVTPQPKMGKWIYRKEEDSYRCSLCTYPCHKDNLGAIPTMYCAGCGANMQEVQDE